MNRSDSPDTQLIKCIVGTDVVGVVSTYSVQNIILRSTLNVISTNLLQH